MHSVSKLIHTMKIDLDSIFRLKKYFLELKCDSHTETHVNKLFIKTHKYACCFESHFPYDTQNNDEMSCLKWLFFVVVCITTRECLFNFQQQTPHPHPTHTRKIDWDKCYGENFARNNFAYHCFKWCYSRYTHKRHT